MARHEKAAIEEFSQTSAESCRTSIRAQIFGGIMAYHELYRYIGFLLIAAAGGYGHRRLISVGVIRRLYPISAASTAP